jgi:hypothetical protein
MPTPGQLSMMLFHLGVAFVAIVPRLPNDPPFPFAIGGGLSFNSHNDLESGEESKWA